jgi:hypothetical protein
VRQSYAVASDVSPNQILPNFFIAGAPKAGTTSFYHHLDSHPQIYMSPIKEPSYFASELRIENFSPEWQLQFRSENAALQKYLRGPMTTKRFGGPVVEWEDYLKLFRNVRDEIAIGEASVSYLWSETAARNIASRIPDAKIILVLRNPVDRAFSQYLQAVSSGLMRASFREQSAAGIRTRLKQFGVLNPFLEFGMYYQQVKRYLDLFPREHVLIHIYEEMRGNSEEAMARTFRFLGVGAGLALKSPVRFMEPRVPRMMMLGHGLKKFGIWQKAGRIVPDSLRPALRKAVNRPRASLKISPEDRAYLQSHYREDIIRLEGLLQRKLSFWLE